MFGEAEVANPVGLHRIVQTLGIHLFEDFLELLGMLNFGGHAVLGENDFLQHQAQFLVCGPWTAQEPGGRGTCHCALEKHYASRPCVPENYAA